MKKHYDKEILESLFYYTSAISILGDSVVIGASLFWGDYLLATLAGTILTANLIGLYFASRDQVKVGIHILVIAYWTIFTIGSCTHLVKLQLLMVYSVIVGLSFLYFDKPRIRFIYAILSALGAGLTIYLQHEIFYQEIDWFFTVIGIFISGVLICVLYLVSHVQSSRIYRYQLAKEADAKAMQAKNEELQQYIESNIQLEQFAHIASHDLKAPLITIGSFAKLLKIRSRDRLSPEEQKYLSFIQENSDVLIDSVNDLL